MFCLWLFWSPQLKTVVRIRNQKNFIKACNLNCLSSNSLKKIVKKENCIGKRKKQKLSHYEKKWSFLSCFFFAKSTSDKYCFLCHLQKQNYPIHHSNQAFNAHQIEISVKPVSIAKGCRLLIYLVFIHWKFTTNWQWHWQSFQ